MDIEERNLTAKAYRLYKNSLFIVLKSEESNHCLCARCFNRKRKKCIKEAGFWINCQSLVRISGTCLEKLFVTDLDMNRIYKNARPNYKRANSFVKCKKVNNRNNRYKYTKKHARLKGGFHMNLNNTQNNWYLNHPISAGRGNF